MSTYNGTSGNDTYTGTSDADTINGLAGNDTLSGGDGNDVINGGTGIDTMTGGLGDDSFYVDNSADVTSERDGQGYDRVYSTVSFNLAGQFIEYLRLTGSTDIDGTGNSTANSLVGNDGNNHLYGLAGIDTLSGGIGHDILDGGAGADKMVGGAGDDTFIVDNAGDTVNEHDSQGHDSVYASVAFSLAGQFVEDLYLTGASAINATGNTLDNALFGNSAANVLNGGTGADHMTGGLGSDTYVVDNSGDVVTEDASAGTDTVLSSISYALTANVEQLTLTGTAAINATGNDLANTLTGNSGNNILDGGAGADKMIGASGDDTYIVNDANDAVRETTGHGFDTVQSSVSYSVKGQDIEQMLLTGSANIDATGNTLDNTLIGNSGNNVLAGAQGSDTLVGAGGADVFLFGAIDFKGASTAAVDRITDFVHAQGDKIDLSGLDAISGGGDDAFTFIGSATFDGHAGELRFDQTNDNFGLLTGDINGDGTADFTIRVDGAPNFVASDFNL